MESDRPAETDQPSATSRLVALLNELRHRAGRASYSELVAACRAAAIEGGIDASEPGTVAEWNRQWDAADSGVPNT